MSRGVPVGSLEQWIKGPEFLKNPPDAWPQRPEELGPSIPDSDPEIKQNYTACASISSQARKRSDEVFERFSSWCRLKRVFAWILWFTNNLRRLVERKRHNQSTDVSATYPISPLNLEELSKAETHILKCVQANCFDEELRQLKESTGRNNETNEVRKSSSLVKLNPVVKDGLIRVGGRLQQARIDGDAQHPIILPKTHHVVDLLIKFYHCVSGHSGLEYMLSLMRQKFWIVKARPAVKKMLNGCVSGRRRQASVVKQKMASLPKDRTTPSNPPFTFTGVDCFGPFEVRRGRTTAKRYGVIFTCLTVRAIHIEVASSLNTESFINALRRFIARRGQPKEIRSDNGGNFVRGERELREEVEKWNQAQIEDFPFRTVRMHLSHTPPWCDAAGGLNVHFMLFWTRKSSIL